MKANLVLKTKQASFPAGTVGGLWVYYLTEARGESQKVITPDKDITFDVEPNKVYTAGVQRLTLDEAPLGDLIEVEFSTDPTAKLIDTAAALTVTVLP